VTLLEDHDKSNESFTPNSPKTLQEARHDYDNAFSFGDDIKIVTTGLRLKEGNDVTSFKV
tara:strand:+ start:530 stop:709 length:180 start_codon:yes stop_codon:yes gene_type:complete